MYRENVKNIANASHANEALIMNNNTGVHQQCKRENLRLQVLIAYEPSLLVLEG